MYRDLKGWTLEDAKTRLKPGTFFILHPEAGLFFAIGFIEYAGRDTRFGYMQPAYLLYAISSKFNKIKRIYWHDLWSAQTIDELSNNHEETRY
jgi:hypothetical protein